MVEKYHNDHKIIVDQLDRWQHWRLNTCSHWSTAELSLMKYRPRVRQITQSFKICQIFPMKWNHQIVLQELRWARTPRANKVISPTVVSAWQFLIRGWLFSDTEKKWKTAYRLPLPLVYTLVGHTKGVTECPGRLETTRLLLMVTLESWPLCEVISIIVWTRGKNSSLHYWLTPFPTSLDLEPCKVQMQYAVSYMWKRGGLKVSVMASGSSGPGASPGRERCVVSLGKNHSASIHQGVYIWVEGNLMLEETLRCTCIPSRGKRNTPSRFMILKLDKRWPNAPLGSYSDLISG